jgi:hypothetical protein
MGTTALEERPKLDSGSDDAGKIGAIGESFGEELLGAGVIGAGSWLGEESPPVSEAWPRAGVTQSAGSRVAIAARRASVVQPSRLPGLPSVGVRRRSITVVAGETILAGLGIRETDSIAKSISPVGKTVVTSLYQNLVRRGRRGRSIQSYPITVTGEMTESMADLGVESNSLRGVTALLTFHSLFYRLRWNACVDRPWLQIACGHRTEAKHRPFAYIHSRGNRSAGAHP